MTEMLPSPRRLPGTSGCYRQRGVPPQARRFCWKITRGQSISTDLVEALVLREFGVVFFLINKCIRGHSKANVCSFTGLR